jgi:hypothetical protein
MSPTILHGPGLRSARPSPGIKRQPCTWTISARMQPQAVDAIERLARQNGCLKGDIVRTALVEFLAKYEPATTVDTVTDPTPTQNVPQPRLSSPYTGSGGSDQNAIRASANRSEQRKATRMQGERLVDKSVVR